MRQIFAKAFGSFLLHPKMRKRIFLAKVIVETSPHFFQNPAIRTFYFSAKLRNYQLSLSFKIVRGKFLKGYQADRIGFIPSNGHQPIKENIIIPIAGVNSSLIG